MNASSYGAASSSVVAYLPPGPPRGHEEYDASILSVLRSILVCTLVRINYRLGREHKYPTPVHDVLAGYDWILENLLPKRSISRVGRSDTVGKVAVCGEHIGGGLATALALTECRTDRPAIVAAAVNNALVDWVSLAETTDTPAKRRLPKSASSIVDGSDQELQTLLQLRQELFAKPENYFDPFASPMLFFRSAGTTVPPALATVPIDDLDQLSEFEREAIHRQELAATGDLRDHTTPDAKSTMAQRRASRRFPSKALGLRLPQFHISAGHHSPLRDQIHELTSALHQSFARESKNKSTESFGFGRKQLLDEEEDELDEDEKATLDQQKAEAKQKATLTTYEGNGWWDTSEAGKARMLTVANWLHDRLS